MLEMYSIFLIIISIIGVFAYFVYIDVKQDTKANKDKTKRIAKQFKIFEGFSVYNTENAISVVETKDIESMSFVVLSKYIKSIFSHVKTDNGQNYTCLKIMLTNGTERNWEIGLEKEVAKYLDVKVPLLYQTLNAELRTLVDIGNKPKFIKEVIL